MSAEVRVVPTEHWSLHKHDDKYVLLVQLTPTQAFDGVVVHNLTSRVTESLVSIAVQDGRVPTAPLQARVVWLRSSWNGNSDGGLRIEQAEVGGRQLADAVMLLATLPLVALGEGGAR